MDQQFQAARRLRGTIPIPGDKSISHRAIMFGALAEGETNITNLGPGQDVRSTLHCFSQLGISHHIDKNTLTLLGKGRSGLSAPQESLDCGNSGTTMRLISGILAGCPFDSILIGDHSLSRRPMSRVIKPLTSMGASINAKTNGMAPLHIQGKTLHAIHFESPVASAQIKSCVLMAGLSAEGTTFVTEPALSRDHTENMLPAFGVPVKRDSDKLTVSLNGPAALKACDVNVPGDISSAAFLMVAAALIPDSEVLLTNVGMNPTRSGIIEVLENMGVQLQKSNEQSLQGEARADLSVRTSALNATRIAGDLIPKLIDEIPILAVAATQATGRTEICDAGELRVKETDRITALEKNLNLMGIDIEVWEDGFAIEGPQKLHGAELETFHDHRIAMAFSVAGLIATGSTLIKQAECAEISYPGFYKTLRGLIHA